MATQTTTENQQQNQNQNQASQRGSQPQGGLARRTGYAVGIPMSTADFFRMNPFYLMRRMTEELDRVFGDSNGGAAGGTAWAPAIEVSQQDGSYQVKAELPGLNPSDVKVEVTDDAIVLQGERKVEHEEDKGGVHVTERRYGKFYREIPLPEGVKADEARAKFENGVLEISMPVEQPRSRRRELPIQGNAPETQANGPGKAGTSSSPTGSTERAA